MGDVAACDPDQMTLTDHEAEAGARQRRLRVVYSCFTRIGASGLGVDTLEILKGVHAHGALTKGVFYGSRQQDIPLDRLHLIRLHPFQIFSNLSSRYYYPLKRMYLDTVTARVIRHEGCDIFHGWSTESLRSIDAAHAVGGIAFVERPSLHPRVAATLLEEEYERFGVRRARSLKGRWARFDAVARDLTVGVEEIERADRIVVQSSFAVETFRDQGVDMRKVIVAPRAVDTKRFVPGEANLDAGVFRVLFVGQACLRKGVPYLLRAWSALRLPRAELWFVGPTHDDVKPVLRQFDDPSVKYVSWSDDPVRLYQSASVFVLPSLVEGSAKVTYEAMACGLPVVVTPNAGSVARDGKEGYVVPIRDDEALQQKLLLLYQQPELRRQLGAAGRRLVQNYTWDHHRATMWAAYQQAVSEGPWPGA